MFVTYVFTRLLRSLFKVLVVGLLALGTMPAQAEYMGGGAIFAPYNCSWPTNVEMTRARYIPGESGDGSSHVTLNFAVGGVNAYTFRSDLTPSRAWRRGNGRAIWGALYWMGAAPQVRVLRRSDAVFSNDADVTNAPDIRLRLRIRNFNGQPGCSVTVALMLHRWN